jgi:predicted HTH domain antitoxin
MNGMNKEKKLRLKESAKLYKKGIISLAEAATLAKVTIYDMMEYSKREQIRPIEPDSSELRKDRTNAEEIFRKLKEEK